MHWNLSNIVYQYNNAFDVADHLYTYLRMPRLSLRKQWSLYVDCFCSCYLTTLDSIDMSILGKGKTPVSISGVEAYSKEALGEEIRRFTQVNIQLAQDK